MIQSTDPTEFAETLARGFLDAACNRAFSGDTSFPIGELSLDQAYSVQDRVTEKREKSGDPIVGYKVGCTSTAIRRQFGLTEPIYGRLFGRHVYAEGTDLFWNDYVNCAVEPEMVLKIRMDLSGDHDLSDEELIDAVAYVSPGIEIHQFTFWFLPKTSQELICSNGIHAGLVVGNSRVSPSDLSFRGETFEVVKDGRSVAKAAASEIMGGPIASLRWLAGCLAKRGRVLRSGSLVIPGSPVELIPIDRDTVLGVRIERVGNVETAFLQRARH